MNRAILVLSLLAFSLEEIAAQEVKVSEGDVYFQSSRESASRRLTSKGLDKEAVLSPDTRWVAFVRKTPGRTISVGVGDMEATELWLVQSDGKGSRRLIQGHSSTNMKKVIADMSDLHFSLDGRTIYFISPTWVTSGAVHAFSLTTKTEHFVCPGSTLEVVPNGEYAGNLIIQQHRYFLAGGSYDWYWLLTPDGKEVGPIGDETALTEFREELRLVNR